MTTVLDNDGFLTAAWDQAIATGKENMMAIHGKVGGTWSDIVPLETDNVAPDLTSELAYPQLAVDAQGSQPIQTSTTSKWPSAADLS